MTTEKRWAIIIKPWGHMSAWACDENGHLKKGEWFDPENTSLFPAIMEVAPPKETPDGVRRKRKGMYVLAHEDKGPENADRNVIATKMASGWWGHFDIYGYAILMDAEAEGKPVGLPWNEARYIIEQWSKKDKEKPRQH